VVRTAAGVEKYSEARRGCSRCPIAPLRPDRAELPLLKPDSLREQFKSEAWSDRRQKPRNWNLFFDGSVFAGGWSTMQFRV
jgi:hypothetical protein